MNDRQLEAVLRRSLARHADTVDSGPTWPLDDDVLDQRWQRGRVVWWPIAAAIVAVLAVLGVVLAVRHASSDRHRPATPTTVTRSACTVDPPQSWLDALGAESAPRLGQTVLGGGPDGAVLVRRDDLSSSQTVLIAPDGSTRTVDERPARVSIVGSSVLDRNWIVLAVVDVKDQVLTEFDVLDRATLQVTERVRQRRGNQILGVALFGGHLYWVDGGRVLDHDIATRQTRTVTPTGAKNLRSSLTGVAWIDAQGGPHLIAGAPLDEVPGRPGRHPDLVTDGQAYAWLGNGDIAWYSRSTRQTVVVKGFPGQGVAVTVYAVAGPYVVVQAGNGGATTWVVDTRTGTVADLPGNDKLVPGSGVLVPLSDTAKIVRLDRLPELHC